MFLLESFIMRYKRYGTRADMEMTSVMVIHER